MAMVNQFEVYLVSLDPTKGSEIQKTRPCLVVSPDEMNEHLKTVIIAPMTTAIRDYPFRVTCLFQGKKGQIALDQLRTIDKTRLVKKLGSIHKNVAGKSLSLLQEMFS